MKIVKYYGYIEWYEIDTEEEGWEDMEGIIINRVQVYDGFQRKGHGTALVEELLSLIPSSITVYLVVEPLGGRDGISFSDLVDFYRGIGFDDDSDTDTEVPIMSMIGQK